MWMRIIGFDYECFMNYCSLLMQLVPGQQSVQLIGKGLAISLA